VTDENSISDTPALSVIVAVYNDWVALDSCLRSLMQQANAPSFEVIVVDDGSESTVPESIRAWSLQYPLVISKQPHSGVSAARNRGAQDSKGPVLLFADADSRFEPSCLEALNSAIADNPQEQSFQLRLTGDSSTLVGRVEVLRLRILQLHLLQPNGKIRYLNTAGFAIRRVHADVNAGIFNTAAIRAEDTLLLADLMERGELPLFVTKAVVQHRTPLSLLGCLRKDVRSAYLESKTYEVVASRGVKLRVGFRERIDMLRSMWRMSAEPSVGRAAWLILVIRQVLRLVVHLVCGLLRI
jgi:glycosyltransferase involved in cell wall biosynthesis